MFRRYSSSRRGAKGLAKSVFLYSYCWSITGSRGCVINVFFSSYIEEANNTGEFRHKGWKRGEVLSTLYFLHPWPRDKVGWAGEKIGFLIYVQQISVYSYILSSCIFFNRNSSLPKLKHKRRSHHSRARFQNWSESFQLNRPLWQKEKDFSLIFQLLRKTITETWIDFLIPWKNV